MSTLLSTALNASIVVIAKPLAAPIYADLTGLAPLLIQVGAAETLLDDAIRLARVAGAADVRVDLQIWPEMIHVWHGSRDPVRENAEASALAQDDSKCDTAQITNQLNLFAY